MVIEILFNKKVHQFPGGLAPDAVATAGDDICLVNELIHPISPLRVASAEGRSRGAPGLHGCSSCQAVRASVQTQSGDSPVMTVGWVEHRENHRNELGRWVSLFAQPIATGLLG